LTAADQRSGSFKEFMEEWIVDQFFRTLDEFGLKKPWYWDIFLDELEIYHHMIYASAYTYRATLWFDFVMPSPSDRKWLREKYPKYWDDMDAVWEQIGERWKSVGPGPDVTYDWGEAFVALNLVLKPMIDELFLKNTSDLALGHNDHLLGQIFYSLNEDCQWHRQWSQALTQIAIEDTPTNRQVIQTWIDKWCSGALREV
jgi:hypothetical protein